MTVKLEHCANISQIEVFIRYAKSTEDVERIVSLLKSMDKKVLCTSDNNEEKQVSVFDIYYFESVDKKVYVYCDKDVYRTENRIYQLAEDLVHLGFVQISKAFLLNANMLASVQPLRNSRIEATLKNGEKVFVTRKYLKNIKHWLQTGGIK